MATELAGYEAHCLLGHVLGFSPTELTLHSASYLEEQHASELEQLVTKRLDGVPLPYVLGRVAFRELDLICDARALIPRPETEELVEIAEQCLDSMKLSHEPVVVDVGTGSGNIALALADEIPNLFVIATDTEPAALALADENRRHVGLASRVQLVQGDTLTMFPSHTCVDLIVSNPPYIAPDDPYVEQSVRDHEPHQALYASEDGLGIITRLMSQAETCLRPGGWFVSEMGYKQGAKLRALYESHAAWCNLKIHRDIAGLERVLTIQRQS